MIAMFAQLSSCNNGLGNCKTMFLFLKDRMGLIHNEQTPEKRGFLLSFIPLNLDGFSMFPSYRLHAECPRPSPRRVPEAAAMEVISGGALSKRVSSLVLWSGSHPPNRYGLFR